MIDLEALRLTLVERPRSLLLRDISHATGLNENWLKAYAAGRIRVRQSPKVETLARYFAERDA